MNPTLRTAVALLALHLVGSGGMVLAETLQSGSQIQAQSAEALIEAARAQAALEPVADKTIPLFTPDPDGPFGNFWMLGADTPPLPLNPFPELPVYPLGGNSWLVDDRSVDYCGLQAQRAEFYADSGEGGEELDPLVEGYDYTTNDLWLEITGFSNQTASLMIHRPWNDTNLTHDLFYTTNLSSPVSWRFLMRATSTNVLVPDLCDQQGFFRLGRTNGDLTVTTNVTPQQMAQLLVPTGVTVTNANFIGTNRARGTFSGGHGCGLPLETGVILSTGDIGLAGGTNDSPFAGPNNEVDPDADLDALVIAGSEPTSDAAVLEFDIVSTNSFVLRFQYVFASEEYPEYINDYNDPMAIFVSTNHLGTNWIIDPTNNIALVPGTGQTVTIGTINGGGSAIPTNPQFYVDNHDPVNDADPLYSAPAQVFNVQYDGMTVMLTAQIHVSANITNHIKIGIEDYHDATYDSAVFIKKWEPGRVANVSNTKQKGIQ